MTAYATLADMRNIYGKNNIETWADIDNTKNETIILARYTWALDRGADELDTRLAGKCPYAIPFASSPALIVYLNAQWAGIELYESRGVTDYDADGKAQHSLQVHVKRFNEKIRAICGGLITFAGLTRIASSAPAVIRECTVRTRHYGPDVNGYYHPSLYPQGEIIEHGSRSGNEWNLPPP